MQGKSLRIPHNFSCARRLAVGTVASMVIMLGTADAANVLGVTPGTMRMWRTRGVGPQWYVRGGAVVYVADEIASYVHQPRKRGRKRGGKNRPKPGHAAAP